MELKKPLSLNQQVQKLIEHGMTIDDECVAKTLLGQLNYYRFTGYALQFRKIPSNSDYVEKTNFRQIYHIYMFDEALRNILRKYLEKVEIYYKTQISYHFSLAKCENPPHNQHYDKVNYYNTRGFEEVINSFKREKNYYKDSLIVKHHRTKYNSFMPLWVMVELMSFSNISKLYNSMYLSDKKIIADVIGVSPVTLVNHLHCLSVLRNKCAHAARLYNTTFHPPVIFGSAYLKKHPEVRNNTLFAYILMLIKRLPDIQDRNALIEELNMILKQYLNDIELKFIGFPTNYLQLFNYGSSKNNSKY